MPGENPEKMASLRLFLASMMVHPGAKLISLGETLADITAAETAKKSASPEKDSMEGLRAMLKDLNELYRTLPALSQNDGRPDGFEWIINLSNEQDLVAFLRKGNHPNDFAYILINYSGSEWKMNTGVPYEGRYKEIFCSSAAMYGGSSSNRLQSRMSEEGETDGRAHRLKVTIPALSLSIFTYSDH
jgi:1,4-alpha-glucan branching enzyme